MEITEKFFWEQYWGDISLPYKVDFSFKNDRVIANTIITNVPKALENQRALEIGCAPGKWMILLNEKLGYSVDGFEYLNIAAEKTRENLLLCNVPEDKFNVVTSDFLNHKPTILYDLVLSLGFIEHFDDYESIFDKHLANTKKNGYVVVGFPSFRGLNYYIQLFIDSVSSSEIISNHNITMMDKEIMQDMLKESKKEVVYIDYIGGFESGLFNTNVINNPVLRFMMKFIVKFFSIIFSNTKNKYISSYLIFVVKND